MKTLKKSSLEELAKIMPVLSEEIQRICIGGYTGDSGDIPPPTGSVEGGWTPPPPQGALGSIENPYSFSEAERLMDAGFWRGGYVEGMGYMLPQLESTAPSGNKPPIPGFPNFGIQSPGTSGVTGYNPGDSGYTNSNGYGGPTGSFIGTGGGSGGSGGSGSGGGGGSSSNEYYGPHITGSTCLPDNEKPNLYYNDTMSALTGVAPGSTNEEIWEQTKYYYFREAKERGVDLYGTDIKVSSERSARAWIDNDDRGLRIGYNFFNMPIEDRISVLIHESVHLGQTAPPTFVKTFDNPVLLGGGAPPFDIYKYIMDNELEHNSPISLENQYDGFMKVHNIAAPTVYENELKAYLEEKRLCPNVSSSYAAERDYRIWYFHEMLSISLIYY